MFKHPTTSEQKDHLMHGVDHKRLSVCCHLTDPEKLPLLEILLVFLNKIFFISSSQIQTFNFFCISLQKCSECALVNYRGATERKRNWNKCHQFFNSYLKSLPFHPVCKKKIKIPTYQPTLKTVSRVTANKLFFKDGLVPKWHLVC